MTERAENDCGPDPIEPIYKGLTSRESSLVAVVAIIVVVALVFCRVPFFDFVYWDDQIHILENPHFQDFNLQDIGYFWQHAYENLYVPLSYTLFGLLVVAGHRSVGSPQLTDTGAPLDPHIFHSTSLILHLVNSTLVFLLLRRATLKDLPAALGTLVFAVHPIQVESVAWISELRGLLSALFLLISINLYIAYSTYGDCGKRAASWTAYSFSFIAAACALLSKPSSVIVGLFIAAVAVWICRRSLKSAVVEALPFVVLGCAFAIAAAHLQPVPAVEITPILMRPFVACDALCFYMAKLAIPWRLAIDYGRKPSVVLTHWWTYVIWIVPLTIGVLAIRFRNRAPYLAFGLMIAICALLPVLGITPFLFQFQSTVADRYMYVAMVGVAIIISSALAVVPQDKNSIALTGAALWIVVLGGLAFNQTLRWRDSGALFAYELTINPDSASAEANMGTLELRRGQYSSAVTYLADAIRLEPEVAVLHLDLGSALAELHDRQLAEVQYRDAIALNPGNGSAYGDLGRLLLEENKDQEGVLDIEKGLAINPEDYAASEALGIYFLRTGNNSSAVGVFARAVHYTPYDESLWRFLGIALLAEKHPDDAVQPLENAVELDPSDVVAKNCLSLAHRLVSPTH